ncbi:hypothetical protein O181_082770 [Austropuccinia psidii MF-1]|uniref:Uncharacterized protein n=1 Tax=Austropuccinia psidii MF-1 TaxID=1389203 RepID=A0A9Q3IL54_9BASI|nr:hypothetical protein [Austropuccinia psidii MF-1]
MYDSYHQDDWHTWLPLAEFPYNNAEHSSTKQSPFLTISGRNPSFDSTHISQDTPAGNLSTKLKSVHMASFQEHQDIKTHQETFRKMVGTLLNSQEDWQPCISPQVASKMEVSSPCLPCVLLRTSEAIKYLKLTSIATTTSISGRARRMGSGSGSGLKTQERYIMVSSGVERIQ